jgi:hypothetical protein
VAGAHPLGATAQWPGAPPVIDDVALRRHGYHLVGAGAIARAEVGSDGSDVAVPYWFV